jgi:DNA-binding response OmpR family regulator
MRGFSCLTVLVVDDNRSMRELTCSLLRGLGFRQAREAANVETAWDIVRQHRPDIVLVDFDLPGLAGPVLIERIRRALDSPAHDMAVILMTAFSDRVRVVTSRDAGASEILAKPISIQSLLDRLVAVVDRPRSLVRAETYVGPDRRRRADPRFKGPYRREGDKDFLDLDDSDLRRA